MTVKCLVRGIAIFILSCVISHCFNKMKYSDKQLMRKLLERERQRQELHSFEVYVTTCIVCWLFVFIIVCFPGLIEWIPVPHRHGYHHRTYDEHVAMVRSPSFILFMSLTWPIVAGLRLIFSQ